MAETVNEAVLFNHLVIEKVLKYLEIPELKNFRQVCKFWNSIATQYLTDKVEMNLEGTKLEKFLENIPLIICSYTLCRNLNIKINSAQTLDKATEKLWPAIHVQIKNLNLQITTLYAKKDLKALLLFHLPNIVSLKLVILKYWGVGQTIPLQTNEDGDIQETTICPNTNLTFFQISYLGAASLYGFDEGDSEEHFQFPIDWKSFLIRFPQLQHIGVVGLNCMDVQKMLKAMSASLEDGHVSSNILKSLEILDENIIPQAPNDEHLLQLTELHNNFEAIHLEVSPVATSSILTDLLKKYSCSLKTLRLRRYPHHSFVPIEINDCSLNRVRFLEISEDLIASLTFLPHLPVLERLHIIIRDYRRLNSCDIVYNTTNPNRIPNSNVKILYIEPPLISKDCIEKLAQCLPGLETFKVRVNNEMMTEVCNQKQLSKWEKLVNLHIISWDGLTDEGITGIEDHILKFWSEFPSTTEVQSYRSKPFIGDLTGLNNLTIEMWSDYENHICDWSVLYGVLQLQNLQEVTFVRCSEISSSVFSAIPVPKKFMVY